MSDGERNEAILPPEHGGRPHDLDVFQATIGAWAAATFPEETEAGVLAHLKREVADELHAGCEPDELADAGILLCQLATKRGLSLWKLMEAKHAVCVGRRWGPMNSEGFQEHVRCEFCADGLLYGEDLPEDGCPDCGRGSKEQADALDRLEEAAVASLTPLVAANPPPSSLAPKCPDCGHWHDESEREGAKKGEGIVGCMWCGCGHRSECPCAGCAAPGLRGRASRTGRAQPGRQPPGRAWRRGCQ